MFGLNQSNDGVIQSANIVVPGCGNQHVRNGSPVAIEVEGEKVTVFIFGDINTVTPTHEIDISGALEKNRKKNEIVKIEEAAE